MPPPSPYTSEFHQELEAETSRLWRRRFLVFTGVVGGITTTWVMVRLGIELFTVSTLPALAGRALTLISPLLCLAAHLHARRHNPPLAVLLRLTFWVIILQSVGPLLANLVISGAALNLDGIVMSVWVAHTLACLLMPWTPKLALRPVLPVVGLILAALLVFSAAPIGETLWRMGRVLLVLSVAFTPGVLISWGRYTHRLDRFKRRFVESRYVQLSRDLATARQIQESLFPRPITTGPLRFDFRCEPMLQIGGDLVYARFAPAPPEAPRPFSFLLIDVTGHGIAAALTVNRLYGEIERIYAENPQARPAEVLTALNRYVNLTLARHSVYATALCVLVDPGLDQLEYASGGHPPAFLRGADGTIDQLPSTAFVLGACPAADFDPAPQHRHFGPGDTLIAYTDGAIESRDQHGRHLGVAGLQGLIARHARAGTTSWTSALLRAVQEHRTGPPADDTIVIEVSRRAEQPPLEHDAAPESALAAAL
ncbi:MAG TPA: PP2C family protein-serine/threonine phosphatase [Phycisphaerales bacterium]|nr:PP2C family protein-serine/threonine phosphatase [Phycisphaerales bacterium]